MHAWQATQAVKQDDLQVLLLSILLLRLVVAAAAAALVNDEGIVAYTVLAAGCFAMALLRLVLFELWCI